MKQLLFGDRTGLQVSQIALGTGRIGTEREGGFDLQEARGVLMGFAEAGGNFIDSSSAYQFGRAEETIGDFFNEVGRGGFVIASKYGRTALMSPPKPLIGSHRKAMSADVEGTLRRLRTDRIDLYFPHFDDEVTPVEEIMAGLNDLARAGKVIYIGLSNFPAWRAASAAMLAELRGWANVVALQLQYNLLERDADREHLPLARARGLGLMGYSPFAGGKLATRLRMRADQDASTRDSIIDVLAEIADELACDPMSVALSWVNTKGIIPVIGPRNLAQLGANLESTSLPLSESHLGRLDGISKPSLGEPYDLLFKVREHYGITSPRIGEIL